MATQPTPPFAGAIFDLDGVLVRTDAFHTQAWARLASDEGWPFDDAVAPQLRGVSRMESLRIVIAAAGVDVPETKLEALAARKNDYYTALIANIDESAVIPGARAMLEELRRRDVPCAVGSSSKNAVPVLTTLALSDRFAAIVSGLDITRSKPDPEVFQKAAAALGMPPARCVVVEDAESGIAAARAAGAFAVGFGDEVGDADLIVEGWHDPRFLALFGDAA